MHAALGMTGAAALLAAAGLSAGGAPAARGDAAATVAVEPAGDVAFFSAGSGRVGALAAARRGRRQPL